MLRKKSEAPYHDHRCKDLNMDLLVHSHDHGGDRKRKPAQSDNRWTVMYTTFLTASARQLEQA